MAKHISSLLNQPLKGKLKVPGDKSISHRAVMFGAIAKGQTTIEGFLEGEDCLSTIQCFQKLGVQIECQGSNVRVFGEGLEGLKEPNEVLDVGNSGTTTRLMLGILATCPFHSVIVGDASIAKRPMLRVVRPLREMGARIDGREEGKFTPISVRGGQTKGIMYHSPVASAQVKSCLLLAGLHSEGETVITEPHLSRDHSERMLEAFGAKLEREDLTVRMQGNQSLVATHVVVPGDISSAAFFMVAAAISKDSKIVLEDVGLNPTRTGIIDVMQQMGASIEIKNERIENMEPLGDLIIRSSSLKGIEISGAIIPRLIDEIPIIALLATQASGQTIIKDAKELKVKETNRIDTVVSELQKLGASITATEDGMIIEGKTTLHGGCVTSFGDHRIGMMLAIASVVATGEIVIENEAAIAVSYPQFFNDLGKLIKD